MCKHSNRSRPIDANIFMVRTVFFFVAVGVSIECAEVLFRIVVKIRIAWSDAGQKKSNIFFSCCNFILASMTHNAFTAADFIDSTEKRGMNEISMEQCESEQKKRTFRNSATWTIGRCVALIPTLFFAELVWVEWVLSMLEFHFVLDNGTARSARSFNSVEIFTYKNIA